MIAGAIPFAGIASWNAFASSGGIGFVFRSIRGLREKIWFASAPAALPRSGASEMLSAIETWAPRYIAPPRGNRLSTDELADVRVGRDGRHEWRLEASSIPPGTPQRVSAPSRPDTKASSGSPLARTNPRAPPTGRPRPIFARPIREEQAQPPPTVQGAPRRVHPH